MMCKLFTRRCAVPFLCSAKRADPPADFQAALDIFERHWILYVPWLLTLTDQLNRPRDAKMRICARLVYSGNVRPSIGHLDKLI